MSIPREVLSLLEKSGQSHLLRWWDDLTPPQQSDLLAQIADIDFAILNQLLSANHRDANEDPRLLAERACPPHNLQRQPQSPAERREWMDAEQAGIELLSAGKVGAIVVAGGEGTRLQFDRAKGLFPIGPVSGRSLLQVFAEQLRERSRRAGVAIPYFVMTSHATHEQIATFFEQNDYFGLSAADVFFFRQGGMPAVDAATGRLLLATKHRIALSPDGHGGLPAALQRAGLFDEMSRRGIEHLYYHQVDNPASILCDPCFLGLHVQRNSDLSTKVVAKVAPEEPMGVVVTVDGRTRIIEYSDLPAEFLHKSINGRPCFRAGNTAIHAFRRAFLERLAAEPELLPFHIARKTVEHVGDAGELVRPKYPNAWKFERFIFDALLHATAALVVETDRTAEFLPIKRASGADSPQTSREGLIRIYQSWLRDAGTEIADDLPVEISPLAALQGSDLQGRGNLPANIDKPAVIGPDGVQ